MSSRKRTFHYGDKEARYRKACERLGTDEPQCLLSDETSPYAIELHHVAGREFDEEVIPLSLNHHARVSDAQKDHPAKIDDCVNPLENIGHFLLGLGDLVAIAAEDHHDYRLHNFLMYLRWKLQEIGTRLIELARAFPNETFENVS